MGISQLKRLDDFISERRAIAEYYLNEFDNAILPYQHPDTNSSWHLFVVKIKDRKKCYDKLKKYGIAAQVHYIPVTKQPFHVGSSESVECSVSFYQHALSIPIYVGLSKKDQLKIVNIMCEV